MITLLLDRFLTHTRSRIWDLNIRTQSHHPKSDTDPSLLAFAPIPSVVPIPSPRRSVLETGSGVANEVMVVT